MPCGPALELALILSLSGPAQQVAPEPLPPQVQLGLRVEAVRLRAEVCGTLVIVPDAPSFLEAVAHWTPTRRYPVLIDDGTLHTRDLIALFARAFQPTRTVRWSSTPGATHDLAGFSRVSAREISAAQARAWGLPAENATDDALLEMWRSSGHVPFGIVVIGFDDPAWPAGLALGAGRGQPLVFVKARQGVDTLANQVDGEALVRGVELGAESTGLPWRALGDALDAVTLCTNTPARFDNGKDHLAMTDRVGRLGAFLAPEARWAWCGQVFGTPAQSAYRAMCALFLQPSAAWLFDGYPDAPPWSSFDATSAGNSLRAAGLRVEVLDTPRQGSTDWRLRASRPVSAGLVMVNTKGMGDFFELTPGQCRVGDVPILGSPACVSFVHSWSASHAESRDILAGRWHERGAYVYIGSVHEPFLQAFVPTPMLAQRLASRAPIGAAARYEPAPWWKIAVFGDPLCTLGPPARRCDEPVPLEGAADVAEGLRDLLVQERFAEGFRALNLSGRDGETARLAATLLDSRPEALTPEAASECLLALFRSAQTRHVWRAFARLDEAGKRDPVLLDALWLSVMPLLEGAPEQPLLELLSRHPRAHQGWRDVLTLARAWHSRHGMASTLAMVGEARTRLSSNAEREQLDRGIREPPEAWGR
jgi:hypothetical protein